MDDSKLTELYIEVSAIDSTEEDVDRMTRQLLSELRNLDVESAELVRGRPAPSGTKSVDPVVIGNITVAVLPTLLSKVVDFVQAWAMRGQGRTVKFKGKVGGQSIDFEGSSEDLHSLLAALEKGKRRK